MSPIRPFCDTPARLLRASSGRRRAVAWVNTDALDDSLGEHVDGDGPTFAASDGGVLDADSVRPTDDTRERVPVAGGVLVYESRAVGKELVGFENVDDWNAVADALAARGHDRGAVYHLPELDE